MIQLDGAGAVLTMFGTIAASATLTGQGTIKASGGRLDIHGAVDATAASTISFEIDSTPPRLLSEHNVQIPDLADLGRLGQVAQSK
jgi:hypothetical protein